MPTLRRLTLFLLAASLFVAPCAWAAKATPVDPKLKTEIETLQNQVRSERERIRLAREKIKADSAKLGEKYEKLRALKEKAKAQREVAKEIAAVPAPEHAETP